MNLMNVNDILPLIRQADVMVEINGTLGFISNATRIGNTWHLFVLDEDTRASLGELTVSVDGMVEVASINR